MSVSRVLALAGLIGLTAAPAFAQLDPRTGARPGHVPGEGVSYPLSPNASNIGGGGPASTIAPTLPAPDVGENATPQQLLPLLMGSQSKDDFALGVFWSVRHKIAPMSGEKSDKPLTDLELIATLVTETELKKQIADAIQFVRKRRPATEKR